MTALALGGGPLEGLSLVRIGFLDEAGRSRNEPILVVAGILLNGDRTYRGLCDYLDDLVRKHVPTADQTGFLFHAKDIFHGTKYFKDREVWPRDRRRPILRDLALAVQRFHIPVAFGYVHKDRHRLDGILAIVRPNKRDVIKDASLHAAAFAQAEVGIDLQMREFPRDEICMLVAEDTDRVKTAIKLGHRILRDPEEMLSTFPANFPSRELVVRKIVDTPHFAKKEDSKPLQIADLCAFLIARRLRRDQQSHEFFELIAPQMTRSAAASPLLKERLGNESLCSGQRL